MYHIQSNLYNQHPTNAKTQNNNQPTNKLANEPTNQSINTYNKLMGNKTN